MFTSDYAKSLFLGFIVALFAVPTLYLAQVPVTLFAAIGGFIIFPVGAVLGFWIFSKIARRIPVFLQLAKFAIVGFSNYAVDSGILSTISLLTGVTRGGALAATNLPGFIVAVLNSYYWNKSWTFKDNTAKKDLHDFLSFLVVTVIGYFINTGTVYSMTTLVGPLGGIAENRWFVIAKIIATIVGLVWNFLGFKFIVFTKKMSNVSAPSGQMPV